MADAIAMTVGGNGPTLQRHANERLQADKKYYDAIETAPRAEIERLQEQRLLTQIPYVYERSALLRSVWDKTGVHPRDIRSLDDFRAKAPFIDKDSLRSFRDAKSDPFGGVLCVPTADLTCIGSSSGTTGDPTLFGENWDVIDVETMHPRNYWHLGIRPGDYSAEFGAIMRGLAHRVMHEMGVIPVMFTYDPGEMERFARWSLRFRPKLLFHLSTPLIYGLEKVERETDIDMRDVFSSFKAVIYGGEPLGPRAGELLKRWGVKVYEFSSLGDSGTIFDCLAQDGMHAWEDMVLVEILEAGSNKPVPDGEGGELVVTNLTGKTDPLIRYRSGDYVRFTRKPCSCGRTHVRIWPVGRMGDEVVVNGVSILPRDVWGAVESVPETSAGLFQIIRPARVLSALKVRVGYEGAPDFADLSARVADAIEARVSVRPTIELVPNAEIVKLGPPHKIPRIAKS